MKTNIALFIISVCIVTASGQSLNPDVVSCSGEYFFNVGASLSWTLGEPVTETFTNGGNILTQGFQQPIIISITGIDLELLVFLEGPYNGTVMNTDLTGLTEFPHSQPYNTAPWNYTGTESVVTVPEGLVDWVLVELRDAHSAAAATAATVIARQAAFLMNDGNIRSLDGTSSLQFDNLTIQHSLFAVVHHRNHLSIMSANPLIESGGLYSYDFSTPAGQAYGTGAQKNLGGVIYGMFAGDADASGLIDNGDKNNVWILQAGRRGYLMGDMNLSSQVSNQDKNNHWYENLNRESQVPD